MELESVNNLVKSGLQYEKARVEAATHNIAIANIALAPGQASGKVVLNKTNFILLMNQATNATPTAQSDAVKLVHDPAHPYADANGMVRYADIDPVHEMATLVSATRAYEANVRAYNTLKQIERAGLEIGVKK